MKKAIFKLASRLILHPWFRLSRGMTLGVRVLVINQAGEILLVRHTYAPGWLFPGGGVERGETLAFSARRELREEAGIAIEAGNAKLFAIYANEKHFRGDHVALYVVRQFSQQPWKPDREIAAAQFFPSDALPDGTTTGTRQRLAEVLDGAKIDRNW